MGLEKEYTGTFVIGQTTPSFDLETQVTEKLDISCITEEMVFKTFQSFTGRTAQLPPAHSAIKVGGKRAYQFARKGKEVELKPREVEIIIFEPTKISLPEIHFRVVCSKGTYIRSLARDVGKSLGVGAYLSQLCRTRIGEFHLSDAQELDDIESVKHEDIPQP